MVTVVRRDGFRVVIFTDDHEPAHVHVYGDGHATINLAGADGLAELVVVEGMTRSEARRALRVVRDHQGDLLAQWRRMHGRTK